jgi:hypothetical protein
VSYIKQGDNNVSWKINITDETGKVNLSSVSTIFVNLKKNGNMTQKQATVLDETEGICEVVLIETDTEDAGTFYYQVVVTFNDGSDYSSDIYNITIEERL